MLKRVLIISSIFLVFMLIAFNVGFEVSRVRHAVAVASGQQVTLGMHWFKVDFSSPPYLTSLSLFRGQVR